MKFRFTISRAVLQDKKVTIEADSLADAHRIACNTPTSWECWEVEERCAQGTFVPYPNHYEVVE